MSATLRWLAKGEHELPASMHWLSAREAGYASTLQYTKRRTEFLLRRWVGKQAVATAMDLSTHVDDLARIEVVNRPSGAPYVLVDGEPLSVDVSLTDRAGWAVCLIGQDLARVGCDLEIVEPRSSGFITDFLTDREQRYVWSLADEAARDAAGNLLWSAKEAALKVLRVGLRRDTKTVDITVGDPADHPEADGWGALNIHTVEGLSMSGWWRREGVFLLTIAADEPISPPEPLPGTARLSEAEPLHSWVDQPLAPAWPGERP